MGLKALATKAAAIAFAAAGDALELITYTASGTASYNTATGVVTHTDSTRSIRALVETPSAQELADSNIVHADATGVMKFTIKTADLASAPKTGDTITRPNSVVYRVNAVRPGDPTTAIYEVFASEPA